MSRERICFVGRGRVGRGLSRAARAAGLDVKLTSGRAPSARALAGASLVLLTVPDPAIDATTSRVVPLLRPGTALVHCAGGLGPEVLAAAIERGLPTGVCHPLVSFCDPRRPPPLAGTALVIAGDTEARRATRHLALALGAHPIEASVHGPAYHAAAALAANGAAALAAVAIRVMEAIGLSPRDARRAIGALLGTVAENVSAIGVPGALSGPIVRGDSRAVSAHRSALQAEDESARRAYDAIAPAVLDLAVRAGLPRARRDAIRRALKRRLNP